jgi:outer membrane protein assembly factor BamB
MQINFKQTLFSINQKKAASIAFILLLALSSCAFTGAALAKTYTAMPPRPTTTAVGVSPTLIGVNQQMLITIMVEPAPTEPTWYAQDLVNVYPSGWVNISCTITSPDGKQDTFMPVDFTMAQIGINIPGASEVVGSLVFYYTPTETGNYSITASFPGQTFTTDQEYANMNLTVYCQPSTSQPTTFTVQQDPVNAGIINGYPWQPLPDGYWSTPVFTNNREWSVISGPWIESGYNNMWSDYNPYSTAPSSPHIVWASTADNGTIDASGLAGGVFGSLAYSNSVGGSGNIILDGNIYQNDISGTTFECISLQTGQVKWHASGSIQGAWRFNGAYQTSSQQNEGGVSEFLIGGIGGSSTGTGSTTWTLYSPADGHVIRTLTNVPADLDIIKYEDGSPIFWCTQENLNTWNTTIPLRLSYDNLICWNFSALTKTVGYAQVNSNNWLQGIQYNVSVMLPASQQVVSPGDNNFRGSDPYPFDGAGVVIVRSINAMQIMSGYDMATGKLLWVNNATVQNMDVQAGGIATSPNGPILTQDGAGEFVAYNVKTGQEEWRASAGNMPWAIIPSYLFAYDNGVNFMGSYDGHVYAYNTTNGKLVWQSDYVGYDTETVYNNQPFNGKAAGAGGILYFSTSTTYRMEPRTRFHEIVAINETTGKFLWTLPMDINPTAIAYGYMIGTDIEDGVQYGFGQGPTTTTVTAPTTATPLGTSVLIQGTVLDESLGQPNTPAISDANMSLWMDYLHGQNATLINSPPTPNGVPVILMAIDPNGNLVNIGTTTSNSDGHYSYQWTPNMQGKYTIYASFTGSNSYYASHDSTGLAVEAAQSTTSSSSAQAAPDYTMTIIGMGIAIIIVVAIATILMTITFRKR